MKAEPIPKKIYKQQLKLFGHLMRMNNGRPVKKIRQAKMTGKNKRGRPRKTWENTIADILKEKKCYLE